MTDRWGDGLQADEPMLESVAIYARSGTDRQSERAIEDQVSLCRAHAEREGWSVAEVFSDAAASGTGSDRPALEALLARAGEFKVMLAEALDRVSRDGRQMAAIRDRLDAAGCRLATVSVSEATIGDPRR